MIKVTENTFRALDNNSNGICTKCNTVTDGVEPDAEKYQCDSCEKFAVYGAEQLLILGALAICDNESQETIVL